MTSEARSAFVWIWLPDALDPVVCGRLDDIDQVISFTYARSYLERPDAVPIYEPELPLAAGPQYAAAGNRLPLCIDDSMPDSWGRQVINYRLGVPTAAFGELTYLLNSGSDRVGALDFQPESGRYVARGSTQPSLSELDEAAERLQAGEPLSADLEAALARGSSLGGARPKALLDDRGRRLIAKFSSATDTYPVVQGEFVAMTLAGRCGLDIAGVELRRVADRFALLVERFDRTANGSRLRVVSALTVLGLDTFPGGRYATYVGIADAIRAGFERPGATLEELFGRVSFNILCGNTDDHGRNHAAFVGELLGLTPAYDICPQLRAGSDARQALAYGRGGAREARVESLIDEAGEYRLSSSAARSIVECQVATIRSDWDEVCDQAELSQPQRNAFMGVQFLNPSALG